jgi:hypothetical protein
LQAPPSEWVASNELAFAIRDRFPVSFNEGLDVPEVNTILMLRPTESPVIFLQQLGRGLRLSEGKTELVVIDLIGNHRSFLTKPQSLLFLLGQDLPPRVALDKLRDHALDIPGVCSIHIELEAIDLLRAMVRTSASDIVVHEYLSFRDANGRRPSAAELFAAGVSFSPIRDGYESWFHFVAAQGDPTDRPLSRWRARRTGLCSRRSP